MTDRAFIINTISTCVVICCFWADVIVVFAR